MEVKQLSQHLSHFPALFPSTLPPTVLVGVAARALGETIPKQGYSCKNAVHTSGNDKLCTHVKLMLVYSLK